jgi:hypothetical protein
MDSLTTIDSIFTAHLLWSTGREDHRRLHMLAAGVAPMLAKVARRVGVSLDNFLLWIAEVGHDQLTAKPNGKTLARWKRGWLLAGVDLQVLAVALPDSPPTPLPLTRNEAAFVGLLTCEGQTGEQLAATLARRGFAGLGPNEISRISKRPHLQAMGVRHRRGSGYYVVAESMPSRCHSTTVGQVRGWNV